MNLTNYEKTPIFRVFDLVKREAERYGVSVLESEIVGLVPAVMFVTGTIMWWNRSVRPWWERRKAKASGIAGRVPLDPASEVVRNP